MAKRNEEKIEMAKAASKTAKAKLSAKPESTYLCMLEKHVCASICRAHALAAVAQAGLILASSLKAGANTGHWRYSHPLSNVVNNENGERKAEMAK